MFEVPGPKNHTLNVLWDRSPETWGVLGPSGFKMSFQERVGRVESKEECDFGSSSLR